MSTKKPFIYLGIFVALAFFYYFYEHKGTEVRKQREELENKALVFSADSVGSFRITARPEDSERYGTLRLERTPDGWMITEPLSAAADSESVARLLGSAASASMNRVVEDSAADLSVFGLDKPQLTLELFRAAAQDSLKLILGNKNPTKSYIYASSASRPARVILLNNWVLSDLNKSAGELRDKRVFHLDRDLVKKVAVEERGSATLVLGKRENTWQLELPLAVPAERDSVDKLLESLEDAEAESFIDTVSSEDLKRYGLQPPELSVKLFEGDGGPVHMLYVGKQNPAGGYYARREGADKVLLLGSELVGRLESDPGRLRARALVSQPKESISRLTLITPGERVTAVKDTAGDWSLTEPEKTGADQSMIDGLLWDLKDLKAGRFIQSPPGAIKGAFSAPFLEIVFSDDQGEKRLAFARPSPLAADSLVYVKSSIFGDLAVVDSTGPGRLVKTFHDLRNKKILDFDTGAITRIALEFPAQRIELEKHGEDWSVTVPLKADARKWKVQNLLWDLSDLNFTRAVSESVSDSASLGFTRASLRIALWQQDSLAAALSFADSIPGIEEIYLRAGGQRKIYAVEKRVLVGIPATVEEFKAEEE